MGQLDANLLFALDALLQEGSVTRAGERLGVSQPTMSASLRRLRRHFKDELLYRSGNAYKLTPLAVQLAGQTGRAVTDVRRIFALQPTFEPATLDREFTIICSDYVAAVVAPPLMKRLAVLAPSVRVHLRQGDPGAFAAAEESLQEVDGLFLPHGFVRGLPHLDLYRDEWMCLVAAGNETVGERLTMQDLARLPWAVNFRGSSMTTAMQHLHQAGVQIRAQVVVNAFLLLPPLVAGTDRIALLPRRLAELTSLEGLRLLPCPFDAGQVVQAMWWHPDFGRDLQHAWLREQVAAVAAELGGDGPA